MAEYGNAFIPAPSTSTAVPKIPDYVPESEKSIKRSPVKQKKTGLSALNEPVKVVAILAVLSIVFGMLAAIVRVDRKIISNNRSISDLSAQIDQANAENVRLKASLGALMSADKIQDYAVSVLGMQKAERYQIHYFEDRDGDKVVISDGKALNADMQGK